MNKEKFEKKRFLEYVQNLPKISFEEVEKKEKPIIFDTNFLFVPFEFKIDIIGEIERIIGTNYQLFIYQGTLQELQNIEDKKDKNKKFLTLIATMLKTYNFSIITSDKYYIDEQILDNAHRKVIIATNDSELRKILWRVPCRVLYMRQLQYLQIQ